MVTLLVLHYYELKILWEVDIAIGVRWMETYFWHSLCLLKITIKYHTTAFFHCSVRWNYNDQQQKQPRVYLILYWYNFNYSDIKYIVLPLVIISCLMLWMWIQQKSWIAKGNHNIPNTRSPIKCCPLDLSHMIIEGHRSQI